MQLAGALYITCRSKTYRDGDLSFRIERELRIKGYRAVNLGQGKSESFGDLFLHLDGEISVDILCALKDRHEIAFDIFVFGDQRGELFLLLSCPVEYDRRKFLFHGRELPP